MIHLRRFAAQIVAVALLLTLSAMLSTPASAQVAPPGIARTWTASGNGLVKLTIAGSGPNYTVHAWGQCSPTPCDWGTVPLGLYAPNVNVPVANMGMATFTNKFSIVTLILTFDGKELIAQTLTNFTDHSNRSCYDQTVIMH